MIIDRDKVKHAQTEDIMNLSRAGRPLKILFLLLSACEIWSGCNALSSLQERRVGEFGRFEFREADIGSKGVVVGVPHGGSEPAAIEYAHSMRHRLGAALVLAYDFARKRMPVSQPLVHTSPISWTTASGVDRGSAYAEFRSLLRSTVGGPLEFYIGVRAANRTDPSRLIEVASVGLTFEQLKVLKESYLQIREQTIGGQDLPRVAIAVDPLDDISWNSDGVKNHGVLMLARRGLIIRMPHTLSDDRVQVVYRNILAAWVSEAKSISMENRARLPEIDVAPMPFGRIDAIAARDDRRGIVIGAPHGSFDWYTGELVEELSYRTSLPAVITRGFTPTECGGWRIDVNRPTERRYPTDTIERKTKRAWEIYQRYSATIFRVARGPLDLYIDMHQNSDVDDIDVATVGISRADAQTIKFAYQRIRDVVLQDFPGVAKANLVIEPVDQVAIGAWAAKDHGILRLAKRSLHFELPSHRVFSRDLARRAYRKILVELISVIVRSPPQ
jgi:hypothetical protein